ncbi:hypothetical protein AALP_AA3G370000 [Arabis alpina]|uniref:RPM1 interacting protein 13 n=1 Tax=Arabis alpina TaxID=50452 RepID=A0A087HE58_ARAAL|nr:hypothetical protein AALP_AA3G370000 [Arabis alpina]
MDSGNQDVVNLSSDDDEVDTKVDGDYFNWLNEVMEAVEEEKSDDSNDVVEVDSQYRKTNSSIQALDDDDDDDCVILDCDPDKITKSSLVDDNVDDDDDDDVLVVGQKGEIACRDFPHPRHSCAKYAFNTTSHDKYCDMCHCYVCDIPAPCQFWCMGVSTVDHCHANDKEKIWKNQRECFRTGQMPTSHPCSKLTTPLPASVTHLSSKPTMTVPASVTVTHQFSRSSTQNIVRLSQTNLPRSQVGIRPCSSSGRVANHSNVSARSRVRQSMSLNHNHGLQSLSSVRNNVIQKDRSNLRSRVVSSGTRHGATNGTNNRVSRYTNAPSTNHSSSIVAPTINPGMFTQQQPNVTDQCSAVTGSLSNVYSRRHSGQNKSGSGNRQFHANAGLLTPFETPLTSANSQAQTVQQLPGTNENVLQTKLVEVESWLMDSSNYVSPVAPLPEPVSQDYVHSLTFDFETFLND